MLMVAKGQITQVKDSDGKWSVLYLIHVHVASKHYTLVEEGGVLIYETNNYTRART